MLEFANGTGLSSYSLLMSLSPVCCIDDPSYSLLKSILADKKHFRLEKILIYPSRPPLEFSSASTICTGSGCCAYLVLIGDCTGKQSPNAHANIPLRGSETLRSCYAGVK